jgi:hypothetical protein
MKTCTRCKIERPLSEFHFRNTKRGTYQKWCKSCAIAVRVAYYKKNRNYEYKRNKAHTKDIKALVTEYLTKHPCVDCTESDPIVLEFDHVRGVKRDNISVMAGAGLSWKTIQLEIAKCEVRCANCHRRQTFYRRKNLLGS